MGGIVADFVSSLRMDIVFCMETDESSTCGEMTLEFDQYNDKYVLKLKSYFKNQQSMFRQSSCMLLFRLL